MNKTPHSTSLFNHPQAGMSLVELLVASTIGLFLVGGALAMYSSSRATYRVNEVYARLQENARFALDAIEPDIRLAGYWGLNNVADVIEGRTGGPIPAELPSDEIPTGACRGEDAQTWVLELTDYVEAYDHTQRENGGFDNWGNWWLNKCGDIDLDELNEFSDAIFIRHVAESAIPEDELEANVFYVRSDEQPRGVVFQGPAEPTNFATGAENHELVFSGFYVRDYTYEEDDNIPSLRRLTLTPGPEIEDQEILANVEAMQVELGLDMFPLDGTVDRYINPEDAVDDDGFFDNAKIQSVRLSLLIRTDQVDATVTDEETYNIANLVNFDPSGPNGFNEPNRRRLVVTKTIYLRNIERS